MTTIRDRSFDSISNKFSKNIYGTAKGKIREAVLRRDLTEHITWLGKDKSKRILDVGGGQGQLALFLAAQGHHVTLIDISSEMLGEARKTADMLGLSEQLTTIHASIHELPVLALGHFDLVMCHAVLEWLVEQQKALAALKDCLAEEGKLSLMYYNQEAQRFANVIYGNFDYVQKDLKVKKKVSLNPNQPLSAIQVATWLNELSLNIIDKTGVRCFHDYMRNLTKANESFEELLALELKYNRQEPYASLGRYTHLVCSGPTLDYALST
ncbi:S-adenosylmethionine-dependent methyltransferase Functionally Coupled to the MukBEF Chromosome Partitioning Mechanism [Pseudoalteromonas luteoviolacea B = ATCC 29581]|nr:S-adenosylmethionine-dependent methyltransferase Functionally Coupled to the MukBEF Chromosome Partitioning Mechanism [Pseudoalteromonas luteoviolacea B = ATCC 29581]